MDVSNIMAQVGNLTQGATPSFYACEACKKVTQATQMPAACACGGRVWPGKTEEEAKGRAERANASVEKKLRFYSCRQCTRVHVVDVVMTGCPCGGAVEESATQKEAQQKLVPAPVVVPPGPPVAPPAPPNPPVDPESAPVEPKTKGRKKATRTTEPPAPPNPPAETPVVPPAPAAVNPPATSEPPALPTVEGGDAGAARKEAQAKLVQTAGIIHSAFRSVGQGEVAQLGYTFWVENDGKRMPRYRWHEPALESGQDFLKELAEVQQIYPATRLDCARVIHLDDTLRPCAFQGEIAANLNAGDGAIRVKVGQRVHIAARQSDSGSIIWAILGPVN